MGGTKIKKLGVDWEMKGFERGRNTVSLGCKVSSK